jgi:cobalt-zinc-cadmium efflux system outer membrane protein
MVTLHEALTLALMNNPDLKALPFAIRAAEARANQAGLRPNPELEIEIEEFGGSGDRHGFNATEASLRIGQRIELAGKRAKRARLASLERELVDWDYESTRANVILRVTQAFVGVLAAQERFALARKVLDVSRKAQSAVAQRVRAGKDSPVDELRAGVVVSQARMAMQRQARSLTNARHQLASLWGSRETSFDKATGDLYEFAPPPADRVGERLTENPDLARWKTERDRQRAAVRLEQARATSDVTIGGGVTRFEETDDTAFTLGLAIPLPLFDRNQGRRREAAANLAWTRQRYQAAQIQTRAALSEAVSRLSSAYEEAVTLRDEVIPKAERAFEAARRGYQEGKFDYLTVLDTQRTLCETDAQFIDAAEAYHLAWADVERLTGSSAHAAGTTAASIPQATESRQETSHEK